MVAPAEVARNAERWSEAKGRAKEDSKKARPE
jgi:hypothetical protein